MSTRVKFPDNFLWGAATSAYQIEGSPLADGAGPSIWQRFSHTPGMMSNGDTGDVACDHYRRMESDVQLMKQLGLKAYRFSIAWSRVMPEGKGRVNEKGLDFYSRLVDQLLENGIEPLATLYHWDLPAALDDRGGWLNPDIADWFADYATVMYKKLDGRVKKWATLNEPWVVTDGGYLHGALAPGHRNKFEAPIASHHLLRSHGAAVQAYRAVGKHQVGIVVNLEPKYPATDSAEDRAAVKRADAYMNRQYLDPVFFGKYPDELKEIFGEAWPEWPQADMDLIRQPIDLLGFNYYTRSVTQERSVELSAQGRRREAARDVHRNRLGSVPAGADRHAQLGPRAVWESAFLHHRKWLRVLRSAGGRRRRARRSVARGLPEEASARDFGCDRAGLRRARLHGVVAAGQSRMVARVLQAVRHRACRFRDAEAHDQGERAALFESDREQRCSRSTTDQRLLRGRDHRAVSLPALAGAPDACPCRDPVDQFIERRADFAAA